MIANLNRVLVVGLAVTGRAVVDAMLRRDIDVVAVDDRPTEAARVAAADRGIELHEAPDAVELKLLVESVDAVIPSPGVPRHHPVWDIAAQAGIVVLSEFDLAASWDDRDIVAITGTNGKTTVTSLVTAMLRRSGIEATAAGNVDTPLVEAIDRLHEPRPDVFVVEASSFRLETVEVFAPRVAVWLNLAPDHLDWHEDLEAYAEAKARIFRSAEELRAIGVEPVAVVPADDPAIVEHARSSGRTVVTFGRVVADSAIPDVGWVDGSLWIGDHKLVDQVDMPRRLPHDLDNAAAAAAAAHHMGAGDDAIAAELVGFIGLPHRMALVATVDDVDWYDDSKATTPDATLAAVSGLMDAVLISGGRNKGLDLSVLARAADRLAAVVAIGEAADLIAEVFEGLVPVHRASSMSEAIETARRCSVRGGAVVLSPSCASFDWYTNYVERGLDFARLVDSLSQGPS
ncbi:MAG: UDP-N-acetylmuramoyl-L-alanine--D-glutamate ligase [Actinomycetia bacterium]|nr:UDP-N-acetylmuramoyl-L-alanine--D-glutamate ligase [Actinomycetes bacterium]